MTCNIDELDDFVLQARLTDSNKNLVARALSLYGELGKAMGPAWEKVGRPILQQCVSFVGDNKKQVCTKLFFSAQIILPTPNTRSSPSQS